METLETLIQGSARAHGHLCPGQVVGVRMAIEGCRLIGIDNPKDISQIKKIIVFVEMDRCATDAIAFVTGVKLGRRSLKFVDNGIMAATFVNLETEKAFRLVSTEKSRELAQKYVPVFSDFASQDPFKSTDLRQRQLIAYKQMPLEDLFAIQEVKVNISAADLPGPTRFKAVCQECGQVVRDKKEVIKNNRILCRPCALGSYFQPVSKIG